MHKVTINGKTEYAENGTLLSDLLISEGSPAEHPCGCKGICRKCTVSVNGKDELSCQYKIISDIEVITAPTEAIYSETGAAELYTSCESLCLALDIGTTTLALALISSDKKQLVRVITRNNPQRIFGADIMSRIEYCRKNGVTRLQKVLTDTINEMLEELPVRADTLYVSGNTTMLHILFGIDCSSIGTAPYTPVFLEKKSVNAESIGVTAADKVESLPCISAFTGADIVAGLNLINMPENGKHSLLIDLGTNAEIVLFSGESSLCTAAAAGPCFEGANISCGMSATEGAVYAYSENSAKTIGNAPVRGVCGTGLIDIVAHLLKNGILDETGYMENDFEIADKVTLTRDDIRQYQLAKSAIYSAVLTLMSIKGISIDDIETVYLSGGFSGKINIENAVITGLIPEGLRDKCRAIRNSSLLGTVKYALEKKPLNEICTKARYIDLSESPSFSELFIENIMFRN